MADQRSTADDERTFSETEAKAEARNANRVDREIKQIRASDIEPYTGLRYLSKLFRFLAVVLVLLLIAEIATGIYTQGSAALPTLLGEASRLIVLAGVLWGTGDFAHLLIDVGHDVRAARILVSRVAQPGKPGSAAGGRPMPKTEIPFADRQVPRSSFETRSGSDEAPPIP